MSFAVMLLALVFGIMAEQAAPSWVYIGFAKPPILMGVVAYYAINSLAGVGGHSIAFMLSAAFIGGILSDSLGALPLGITSLIFAVVGGVLRRYRDEVFSGKPVTNIVFGAVLGLIMPLTINAALLFFDQTPYFVQFGPLVLKIVGSTMLGALLFPVIYFSLERLELLIGAETLRRFHDDLDSNN